MMKKIAFLCACLLLLVGCGRSLPVVKGDSLVISEERKTPRLYSNQAGMWGRSSTYTWPSREYYY